MASEQQGQSPMFSENGDHRHSGWFCCEISLKDLATRILSDECALVGWRPGFGLETRASRFGAVSDEQFGPGNRVWCLTHGEPGNYYHHKDRQELKLHARQDST